MKTISAIIKSMRIRQWIKNLFIFIPLIFGGKLFNLPDFCTAAAAFFVFCLTSSGVYLLNDIKDKKQDGFHPLKRTRAIASGELKTPAATAAAVIMIIAALVWSAAITLPLSAVVAAYIILHIFYTFRFKHTVLLDVIIIALGFELRIWGGSIAADVLPSIWLQLCVFLLALFLGFIKRRCEKTSLYADAEKHRDVLSSYKVYFLDHLIIISATLCIVFYGLYSVSGDIIMRTGNTNMAYTIPLVIYGIFRYLYIVHTRKTSGDPGDILISDPPLVADILLWVSAAVFLVYGPF